MVALYIFNVSRTQHWFYWRDWFNLSQVANDSSLQINWFWWMDMNNYNMQRIIMFCMCVCALYYFQLNETLFFFYLLAKPMLIIMTWCSKHYDYALMHSSYSITESNSPDFLFHSLWWFCLLLLDYQLP